MESPKILIGVSSNKILEHINSLDLFNSYQIITSKDGEEAIEQIIRIIPQLIILDWSFPKIDGFQICQDLKSNHGMDSIPVLLLKSEISDNNEYCNTDLAANAILAHPIHELEITAAAANLLNIKINFLELPHKALKDAILTVFRRREWKTIKKEKLLTETLALLKIITREGPRKKFGNKLLHAASSLMKQGIIDEYSTQRNQRLKILNLLKAQKLIAPGLLGNKKKKLLTENKQAFLTSFSQSFENNIFTSKVEEETSISFSDTLQLPDLPEAVFSDIAEPQKPDQIGQSYSDNEKESEKDRLVEVFTKKGASSHDSTILQNSGKLKSELFDYIKDVFWGRDGIEVESHHREIVLKFNLSQETMVIHIKEIGLANDLIIIAYLPFVEAAICEILALYSRIEFIGGLCLESIHNSQYLGIKTITNPNRMSCEDIVKYVDQIISESISVMRINEKYYDRGSF